MNKNLLLVIGGVLIIIGLVKPNFDSVVPSPNPSSVASVEKPSDSNLLELSNKVAQVLKDNNASKSDCVRLSGLYGDLATLISLDEKDEVLKTTEEVRQANRIAGLMLKMNLNDKYPNLASTMNSLVVKTMGDDNVPLNKELRAKAVSSFKALSWATLEGAK